MVTEKSHSLVLLISNFWILWKLAKKRDYVLWNVLQNGVNRHDGYDSETQKFFSHRLRSLGESTGFLCMLFGKIKWQTVLFNSHATNYDNQSFIKAKIYQTLSVKKLRLSHNIEHEIMGRKFLAFFIYSCYLLSVLITRFNYKMLKDKLRGFNIRRILM